MPAEGLAKPGRPTRLRFETTRWSLVDRARDGSDQALADLTERLWSPIYAWLRRNGRSHDDAADLTQGFMTDVVLARGLLAAADPDRGRLRTLVLTSLKNYLVDQHRKTDARRDLDPRLRRETGIEEQALAAFAQDDPDTLFDRRFAAAILDTALIRVRDRLSAADRQKHWRAFELRVLLPATTGQGAPSTQSVAEACGFKTPALVAAAVQSVRKKTLTTLREVVAETAGPGNAEHEYQRVLSLLS